MAELLEPYLSPEELKRKATNYGLFVDTEIDSPDRHLFYLPPTYSMKAEWHGLVREETGEWKGSEEVGNFIGVVLGLIPAAKFHGMNLEVIRRYYDRMVDYFPGVSFSEATGTLYIDELVKRRLNANLEMLEHLGYKSEDLLEIPRVFERANSDYVLEGIVYGCPVLNAIIQDLCSIDIDIILRNSPQEGNAIERQIVLVEWLIDKYHAQSFVIGPFVMTVIDYLAIARTYVDIEEERLAGLILWSCRFKEFIVAQEVFMVGGNPFYELPLLARKYFIKLADIIDGVFIKPGMSVIKWPYRDIRSREEINIKASIEEAIEVSGIRDVLESLKEKYGQ